MTNKIYNIHGDNGRHKKDKGNLRIAVERVHQLGLKIFARLEINLDEFFNYRLDYSNRISANVGNWV